MAALVISALLCSWLRDGANRQWRHWLGTTIFGLITMGLLFAIALTYSRGGYLGVAAGYCALALLSTRSRWIPFACLALFLVTILAAPSGAARLGTAGHIETDASIYNRFAVWKGALAIMADNWTEGVGFNHFREIFALGYQPEDMHEVYRSAVDDYLSLGAYGGIGLLWGYLFAVAILVTAGSIIAYRRQSAFISGLLAGVVSYLVASIWSTFITMQKVALPYLVLVLLLAGMVVRYRKTILSWRRIFLASLGTATGIAAAFLLGGRIAAGNNACKAYSPSGVATRASESLTVIAPRHGQSRGTVIFLREPWFETDSRSFIRPLADAGWAVAAIMPPDFGFAGVTRSSTLITAIQAKGLPPPYFLIGHGDGGRLALIVAAQYRAGLKGVVIIDSPSQWPMASLDPLENVGKLPCPLLILHAREDKLVSVDEAKALDKKAVDSGVHVSMVIFDSADHTLADRRHEVVDSILNFMVNSSKSTTSTGKS